MEACNDNLDGLAFAVAQLSGDGLAPEREVPFALAWLAYQADQFFVDYVYYHPEVTVDQLMACGRVDIGWFRYFSLYHPSLKERGRCVEGLLSYWDAMKPYA